MTPGFAKTRQELPWLYYPENDSVIINAHNFPSVPSLDLTNLISWWSLDEASGTRIDSHGSNDLADNNTVGSAVGKIDNAASFVRANTEFLSLADNADMSTGDIDFTFCCWVKIGILASGSCILSKESDNNNREYRLEVFANKFRWITFKSTGAVAGIVSSAESPIADTWYFLCVSRTAGTVSISVNDGTPATASESDTADTTAAFRVGFYDDGSIDPVNYWDGLIDEVGFWKRLLTADERTEIYNAGSGIAYPG